MYDTRDTGTIEMDSTTISAVPENESNAQSICEGMETLGDKNKVMLICYTIFFILGVFGNGILVLLFLMKKNLRTINNALISNLTFSDFLFVILYVPIKYYEQFFYLRPFGQTFCVISVITNYSSQDESTISMTILAYLRYRAVMRPLQIRQDDQKQRKWIIPVFCIVMWCVAIVAAWYPASHCQTESDECWFLDMHYVDIPKPGTLIFQVIRFFFMYLLPLTTIAIFYSMMACKLCRAPTFLQRNDSSCATRASRSRKKLSGILLAIVIIFFLSWLPNYLTWLIGLTHGFINIPVLVDLRSIFMFFPASLNPILLFVTSSGYRQALLELGAKIKHRPYLIAGFQKLTHNRRCPANDLDMTRFREQNNS